jgi:FAD/FMN-containing dehydrogenase
VARPLGGATPLLALPKSTAEVAAVVSICAADGVAITPRAATPAWSPARSRRARSCSPPSACAAIRDVDVDDDAIVVEAGVTLQAVQDAAAAAGAALPAQPGLRGLGTIGGLISTNAGGTQVLRYGTMRALVLGIEAVLPNGEVWDGSSACARTTPATTSSTADRGRGHAGVITAASLKLFPILASRAVAIVGLASPADAVELLARAKAESGGQVEAFELMGRWASSFALKNIPGHARPAGHDAASLVRADRDRLGRAGRRRRRRWSGILTRPGGRADRRRRGRPVRSPGRRDVGPARNQSAAQKPEGATWKHDVSVPVSQVAAFLDRGRRRRCEPLAHPRSSPSATSATATCTTTCCAPTPAGRRPTDALRDEGSRLVHDIAVEPRRLDQRRARPGGDEDGRGPALQEPGRGRGGARRARALDPKRIMNPRVLF